MALVKTSSAITSIKGKLGGVYFKSGRDGIHVQAMPRRYIMLSSTEGYLYTTSKGKGRGFGAKKYTVMAQAWRDIMELIGIGMWFAFALATEAMGLNIDGKPLTAYQLWIKLNMPRSLLEREAYTNPPKALNDLPAFIMYGPEWSELINTYFSLPYTSTLQLYSTDIIYTNKPVYRWWLWDYGDLDYYLAYEGGSWRIMLNSPLGPHTIVYSNMVEGDFVAGRYIQPSWPFLECEVTP